jgi:hypothetical protein
MSANLHDYGKPNPNAPAELAHFAFLVGKYECDARLKLADGRWQNLKATWEGKYILEGFAIADDYRMTTPAGERMVLGTNFRSYDAKAKSWNIKWLNALTGAWMDLGAPDLGGVHIDEHGIRYIAKETPDSPTLSRAIYTNISANHFTWIGDHSVDGKSWTEFMRIECQRTKK